MTKPLRPLSIRPELVVDPLAAEQPALLRDPALTLLAAVVDGTGSAQAPLGRNRLVSALGFNRYKGPVQLRAPLVLKDHLGRLIYAPNNTVVGERNAIWVQRMVTAAKTLDTRRL